MNGQMYDPVGRMMSTDNNIMKLEAKYNGKVFIIEEDMPEVGAYLYVLEGGRCVVDYLQNDIETCIAQAFEEFGVPFDSWVNIVKEDT